MLRDATVTGNHASLEGGGAWLGEIRDNRANTGGDGVTESGGVHHEGPFLFPEVVNNLFAGNDGKPPPAWTQPP